MDDKEVFDEVLQESFGLITIAREFQRNIEDMQRVDIFQKIVSKYDLENIANEVAIAARKKMGI